jgi:hypothetical protein
MTFLEFPGRKHFARCRVGVSHVTSARVGPSDDGLPVPTDIAGQADPLVRTAQQTKSPGFACQQSRASA